MRTNAALAERARNPPPARSRPIRDPRAPLSPAAAREGEARSRVAPRPRVAPARSSRRAAIETRAGVGPRAARSIAIATLDASGEEEEPANRPAVSSSHPRAPLASRPFADPLPSSRSSRSRNSTKLEKMTAAATAASAAALANPLVAEAAVTPSLKNTLLSVVAGGLVLGAIAAAVIGVSTFDKIGRK